jgi:TonB-dependent receptor
MNNTSDTFNPAVSRCHAHPGSFIGKWCRLHIGVIIFLAAFLTGFAQSTGTLTVVVSNQRTGVYLQKARVDLLGTNRSETTNELGVAVFTGVPPGSYSARVSYTGLDDRTHPVTITAGQGIELTAELSAKDIVQMETFMVTEERDGNAASQIRQKNSGNLVNVIATDALGMLAGDNPAEILARMPGIYSVPIDEGEAGGLTIRGMGSQLNAVTADGAGIASGMGMSRTPIFTNFVASVYDEIEVTKANRPDQPADSIGGRINFKTRTGLSRKDAGHEFTYFVGGRWLPGIFDYTSRLHQPPLRPNLRLGYVGLYNAFGKRRNLGVTANFSYQQNGTQRVEMYGELDYNNPDGTNTPRFSTNHTRYDYIQDRELTVASVRFDYKFSADSTITLSYEWKKQSQNFDNPSHFGINAVAYISPLNTIFGATETDQANLIAPSSTLDFTRVIAPTSNRTRFTSQSYTFIADDKTDTLRFGGDHRLGDWKITYNLNYSRSTRKVGGGGEDYAGMQLNGFYAWVQNIGWTIDRRSSREFPVLTQTEGASIYDVNSYTDGRIVGNHGHSKNELSSADINLSRSVSLLGLPVKLSTGGVLSRKAFDENRHSSTFYYVGEDGRQGYNPVTGRSDDNLARFQTWVSKDPRLNIGDIPVFNIKTAQSLFESNPELWHIASAYTEAWQRQQGIRSVEETTKAAFVQADALLGRLGIITGVRMESTDVKTGAWVKQANRPDLDEFDDKGWQTRESAGRRVAAEYRHLDGSNSYTDYFPSVHLRYALTRDTILRASYSTAMGRPDLSTLIPAATYNSTTMRVTFGAPGLKPQYSTAYDVSFEHYYKPMGMISAGVFRKDLKDFTFWRMVTEDDVDENGMVMGMYNLSDYMAIYPGYEFIHCGNGGKGRVQGVEVSWEHQLTFLPGYFKGLSLSANYTKLEATGDYGGGEESLTGFVPNTLNIRVNLKVNRLTTFIQWSWMDRYLDTYDGNPQRRIDTLERNIFNVGVSLKLGRYATLAVTASNILDEPQRRVHHVTGDQLRTIYNSPFVTVGLSGRF